MERDEELLREISNTMTQHTASMLKLWLVDRNRTGLLEYYNKLSELQQSWFIGALRDVIVKSGNAQFSKAAKEIPEYINQNT